MGNSIIKENILNSVNKISENTHDYYCSTNNNNSSDYVKDLRDKYKVIDVDYFVPESSIKKKEMEIIVTDSKMLYKPEPTMVFDMMDFCFKNDTERYYQKIDYVCNEKERVCICNTHADDFRKIYDGKNYKEGIVNVIWVKKRNERF